MDLQHFVHLDCDIHAGRRQPSLLIPGLPNALPEVFYAPYRTVLR